MNKGVSGDGMKCNQFLKLDDCIQVQGMKFVYIPPGHFLMGSPEKEKSRRPYELLHKAIISKGFYLQCSTVTVGLWRKFVSEQNYKTEAERHNGAWKLIPNNKWKLQKILPRYDWQMAQDCMWSQPGFPQGEDHPVTCISWNDTQEFLHWLTNESSDYSFRLPTEAEWEYSCRAGSRDAYSFGSKLSVCQGNINRQFLGAYKRYPLFKCIHKNKKTCSVRHNIPNVWNLHSMHGNVWEWCNDRSESENKIPSTYVDGIVNPLSETGEGRVLRGGSWAYSKRFARSAKRRVQLPDYRASGIGFRLVLLKKEKLGEVVD